MIPLLGLPGGGPIPASIQPDADVVEGESIVTMTAEQATTQFQFFGPRGERLAGPSGDGFAVDVRPGARAVPFRVLWLPARNHPIAVFEGVRVIVVRASEEG